MNNRKDYVIGIDFGTNSVRSVLVDARSGEEKGGSEFFYPRWKEGMYCDASENRFRQHPLDHIEGLENVIPAMLRETEPEVRNNIRAISIDTTGSTPVAVDRRGTPLALHLEFRDNPNAMFFLWKDHSAVKEAEAINRIAESFDIDFLKYVGGIYSSEWFWAKLMYVLRKDEKVKKACHSWVEHCDWIPFLLTGGKDVSEMKRSVCAAGHKALWAEDYGGYPAEEFFSALDPALGAIRRSLPARTYASDNTAGKLSPEWAGKLGLSTEVLIGVGALDAHMGAVGGQIEPYYVSKVMGTSTCDMVVVPAKDMDNILVKGICGQVQGSIIPGMLGLEAGQSAFGDIYAWFRNLLSWPLENLLSASEVIDRETSEKLVHEIRGRILLQLNKEAAGLSIDENTEIAVDWWNGRRTPDADQLLKGALQNLTLGSTAPRVYRSLAEATCFGSRRIIERFIEEGIPVKGLIGVGGVARKSPFIEQMMADVTGMPIKVHRSEQTCALGASMFAATVAGIYPKVEDAMENMGKGFEKEFFPDKEKHRMYNIRYESYGQFCSFIEQKT
ncbi:ribulokinase [Sinomicrobium weinanense]|uniref:Ribulokinase n=1 Tax=Sinomicrobium weinanense TaxID=2842200 RepID=A0A926JQP6_9FLAO|nr:ribulokinase [Sinomicrobium weinanense]MBC9795725.1 ribulokinase [Sinomicrobium weinanense]MBU3125288.1 ribulokinase [Sinomicrobium weinanense]